MYMKKKDGMFCVWSSKKASLDCMPQHKFKTKEEAISLVDNPESWCQATDMTFSDLDINDSAAKSYHLCPYSTDNLRSALSVSSMMHRVKLIDTLILKGLSV